MSLGYLISPALQLEDINGKPLVGGYLVTYLHGTTVPYITYADFDGNHNPAKVPLNARGMAILLADADNLYDVYCYDCHDVEQWSRINIGTIGTGGEGGAAVSYEPSVMRTSSAVLNSDGDFQFNLPDLKQGELIDVVGGRIVAKAGIYHFSATAKIIRSADFQNTQRFPKVFGPVNDIGVSFNMTFAHNEELTLSGDVRAPSDDYALNFRVSGIGTGLQCILSSVSIHAITSLTAGGSGGGGSQVQSDWTCETVDDPAYILHKPTEVAASLDSGTELVAGENITFTDSAAGIVISASGSAPLTWHEDTTFDITVTASEAASGFFERLVTITNQTILSSNKTFAMIYQCHVEADDIDPPSIPDNTALNIDVYNYPSHHIDAMTGLYTNLGGAVLQAMHSHGSVVLGSQMLADGRLFTVCFPRNTLTEGDKFRLIVRAIYIELSGVN